MLRKLKKLFPFIILLVLACACILVLSSKNDKNPLKRNYNSNGLLVKNDVTYRYNTTDFNPVKYTNANRGMAFVRELFINDSSTVYNITFVDPELGNQKDSISINLAPYIAFMHASPKLVFFKKGLDVFKHDVTSNTSVKLTSKNLSIFNLFPLDNTLLLCMGNQYNTQTQTNTFGFFTFNLQTMKVEKMIKNLKPNPEDVLFQNYLKYDGKFIQTNNQLTYVYAKYGKVLIFDKDGTVFKEISTIDNIKLPETTFFNDVYTYKRGATFSANSSAFIYKNQLYTFSCAPSTIDFIVGDCYDITSGTYQSSFKFEFKRKGSISIHLSYHDAGNNIILGFDNFYQGFTLQ